MSRAAALQRRRTEAGAQGPAIHRFHLMINSSIGDGVVVDTILDTVTRIEEKRK